MRIGSTTAPGGALPACSEEHLARLRFGRVIDLLVADEDRAPRNVIDDAARLGDALVLALQSVLRPGTFPSLGEWTYLHKQTADKSSAVYFGSLVAGEGFVKWNPCQINAVSCGSRMPRPGQRAANQSAAGATDYPAGSARCRSVSGALIVFTVSSAIFRLADTRQRILVMKPTQH